MCVNHCFICIFLNASYIACPQSSFMWMTIAFVIWFGMGLFCASILWVALFSYFVYFYFLACCNGTTFCSDYAFLPCFLYPVHIILCFWTVCVCVSYAAWILKLELFHPTIVVMTDAFNWERIIGEQKNYGFSSIRDSTKPPQHRHSVKNCISCSAHTSSLKRHNAYVNDSDASTAVKTSLAKITVQPIFTNFCTT